MKILLFLSKFLKELSQKEQYAKKEHLIIAKIKPKRLKRKNH